MTGFTLQETNLICLYHSGSLAATIAQMREALPEISEPDVLDTLNSIIQKLELLDEGGYNRLEFDPMAPIGFSEEYGGAADGLA